MIVPHALSLSFCVALIFRVYFIALGRISDVVGKLVDGAHYDIAKGCQQAQDARISTSQVEIFIEECLQKCV